VSKRIGADLAPRHALKTVISYGCRGAERALYVAGFQEISLLRRFCPDASETIRLQL
jgi:hypothetical protein